MPSSWIKKIPAGARKPERFQAVYRDGDGRQRSAGIFARKGDAKKALAEISVATERGTWVDPARSKTLVSVYAQTWLAQRQVAASTMNKLEGQVRREIVPTFGKLTMREVRAPLVKEWVASMSTRLAPETVRGMAQTFRSMMGDAVVDGYLPTNPVRLSRGDLPRQTPSTKMFLTMEQLEALTDNIDPHYRAMVHLTAWTGMRWGEVVALEWDSVDLDEWQVQVVRAAAAGVNSRVYYGPPKTEASRRTIGLDRDTVQVLRKHRIGTRGKGLVFKTKGGGAISASFFRKNVWNPACVAAFGQGATGLERACPTCPALAEEKCRNTAGQAVPTHKPRHEAQMPTFHDLRHTHLSQLLASGVDPVTVSKRAGHSSTVMTLNTYGRLRPDHRDAVNEAISRIKGTA